MWTTLTPQASAELTDARLQIHWAAQAVAAAAVAHAESKEDFSHTTLVWDSDLGALLGVPLGAGGVRVGIAIAAAEVLCVAERDGSVQRLALEGRNLDEVFAWVAAAIETSTQAGTVTLARLEHDVPDHTVAGGAPFDVAGEPTRVALQRLEHWFANGWSVLDRVRFGIEGASELRVWPHHFDLATLVTVASEGGETKTVGLGLSPGDGTYDEPYFYVSPWPYPPSARADERLPLGHWHTEGFFAAVLTESALLEATERAQSEQVLGFLRAALSASRRLLGLPTGPVRSSALAWHRVGAREDLPAGRVKSVSAGLEDLCLTHYKGCYAALTNACPHQGGPLGEGSIENGYLRCPWHGWDFDPLTGASPAGHDDRLDSFPLEVRHDGLYVGVPEAEAHVRDKSDVLVETMVAWGVRWVFGMVGHSNLGLADAIRRATERGDMGYLGIRHEGAASFAVSAYGKLTGRPAACLSIAGPGATNLLTGLWDAHVDRAPAVALTGQVKTQFLGRGAFQEIDLKEAFGGVAAFSATLLHESAPDELATLACKSALLDRGVAHLVCPDEVQVVPAPDVSAGSPAGRLADVRVPPSETALAAAVDCLRAAKRPVIIVGHGARAGMDEVVALAEAFGVPVVTTFKAKGAISDLHPLGCGVLGRSGTPVASWFMNEADVLLVFGSSFSNHTGITDYKTIVQVDFEAEALGRRHPVTVPVLGDVGASATALRQRLEGWAPQDQRAEVAARWKIWREEKCSRLADDRGEGIGSALVFDAMSRLTPADAIVAVDVGNNAYSFGRYFESDRHDVLMSGYLGSIGFALPAAMGAWVATQEDDPRFHGRKVVAVAGDGGVGQYLADLTTWVKYGMNATLVVLNNGELGKISKEQRGGNWPVWETGLKNPSFAAYAELCGALGVRVTDREALDGALQQALGHDGPAVVEIVTDALLY